MKIIYYIYQERVKRNMSLRDLAEKSQVSKTQINDIENGKVHPTVLTLCQIAMALQISPYKLFELSVISDK